MPGFHFSVLRTVGPIEKVVLCLKSGDMDEIHPLCHIPSAPEII